MQAIPSAGTYSGSRPTPVAIYTRVSTIDQVGGRFDSCASQEQLAREHILKNADRGWYLNGVFSDPAYSGGSMKRPGMQSLMRHIESGRAEVVLIFKFERVLRSTDEWTPFRAFLKKHGCRLESPIEDLADETPMQRFNNNMRANLSEYERLNTAEKVRVKMLAQAKRGIWNSGQVPYGYDYDRASQTLRPNPKEAAVVRRIFEAAAQLVSLTDIANLLNAEGLRTKVRVFQRRDGRKEEVGGRRFRSDKLHNLICSPIYRGRVRLHGEEFPAKHEPLVSRELWETANAAVAKATRVKPYRVLRRDRYGHILKGLIFCGCCKRALQPDAGGLNPSEGRPYRYYVCGALRKEGPDVSCPVGRLSAELLESAAVRLMGAIGRRPEIVSAAIDGAKASTKSNQRELRRRLTEIDEALARISKQLGNFAEALAVGGVEAITDEIRAKADGLKQEKDRLLVERERQRQELVTHNIGTMDSKRLAEALANFERLLPHLHPEEKRELVALCVDRIEIHATGSARAVKAGHRTIEFRMRLHAAQLVAGMEERVVVQVRQNQLAPINRRLMNIKGRVDLGGPERPAQIVSPFSEVLDLPEPTQRPAQGAAPRHLLHRALRWQRKLDANPGMNQAGLARTEGISEKTLSRVLKMVRLLPEIQQVLLQIKTKQDLRRFSATKMLAIASLPPQEQQKAFRRMAV